ncbi:hypothetical protein ACOSQ3_026085 [Xanthoceras sorbifolium]
MHILPAYLTFLSARETGHVNAGSVPTSKIHIFPVCLFRNSWRLSQSDAIMFQAAYFIIGKKKNTCIL